MATPRTKAPGAILSGEAFVIPDSMFDEIDGARSWSSALTRMCDNLKIPDLTTRHGLKRVHARFNELYKRLDATYSSANRRGNEKAMGSVVGIMAKMCADAILRDKLFQKGLLQKVMPLLDIESTRHIALQALTVVTHHGGLLARQEIARHNGGLTKIMQDHPDDPKIAELVIITVAHATEAVVACEETPDPRLVKAAAIRPTLQATLAALRRPTYSHVMHTHALSLLTVPTQHCPQDCKAVPSLLNFFAAMTRSKNINTRAVAFTAILRLPIAESEYERSHLDPNRLLAIYQRGTPQHLSDILMDYGPESSELYLTIYSTVDYQKAMMQALQDRDMYSLGKKLVDLIQRTEFAIAEGGFQMDGPGGARSFANESIVPGLPFARWTDALPLCAKAMRAKCTPADLDAADIIEMKFYMIRGRLPEAIALGHSALKRNRDLAYAYYIVSMGADVEDGLRAVKKGLKCKKIASFVRFQMLWRAVGHAAQRGLEILRESAEGDMQARAEGTAFLMSAWEDAKTYVLEAPPDSRHMLEVLSWYALLTILIRGHELSEDLRELDPARRKMKTAMEFMNHMGYSITKTQLNLARELILKHYTDGAREWGAFVKHCDDLDARFQEEYVGSPPESADDDLAEWLERIDLVSDDEDHGGTHGHSNAYGSGHHHGRALPQARNEKSNYELYRCSWCGNPSAVLRKCGGCGNTRYCDSGCQKSHWSEHKLDCKGRSSS
ncbi:hypothetical protein BN946_scf184702.g2 [Trametes cinnabarina]|uniref:MYND-type domain-containing protein n=1 Tax=Pycnoporus cinnabarinus TaxID=5643 RepID=A0A060SV97_PYCCI|nr:hypothetical protein BN946_scf184702.g2 [Trametes cinnabarina]